MCRLTLVRTPSGVWRSDSSAAWGSASAGPKSPVAHYPPRAPAGPLPGNLPPGEGDARGEMYAASHVAVGDVGSALTGSDPGPDPGYIVTAPAPAINLRR